MKVPRRDLMIMWLLAAVVVLLAFYMIVKAG